MKKSTLKILFFVVIVSLFCVQVDAAPTVKKLGTAAATQAVGVKSNVVAPSRAASVRFDATKATTVAPKKAETTETDTTSRLPSSKYLQVVHSVKQNTSNGTSGTSPTLSSEEMMVIKDKIENHINDTDVHVTVSEKETWNEKQDSLTAGEGIEIEDNVISATMKLPVGSEDAPHTAPIWIE